MRCLATVAMFLATFCAGVNAQPQSNGIIRGIGRIGDAIQLDHLSTASGCPSAYLVGRVVSDHFDENGSVLKSLTIKDGKGVQTSISVDKHAPFRDKGAVVSKFIERGLRSIVRKGNQVSVLVYYCDAAGHVAILDSIRKL